VAGAEAGAGVGAGCAREPATVTVRDVAFRRCGVWKQFEARKQAKKKDCLVRDNGSGRSCDGLAKSTPVWRAGRVQGAIVER